jgi:hypothetical protein
MVKGTELRTIADGIVEKIIYSPSGLGKAVYVKWENGMTAIYGHMNKFVVSKGDKLEARDLIGYSGNTGNVVGKNGGYHLHLAIKDANGAFIDPEPYAPFIQEMNHGLTDMSYQVGSETGSTNMLELFNHAIDKFSESLSEMNINLIDIIGLFDYSPLI